MDPSTGRLELDPQGTAELILEATVELIPEPTKNPRSGPVIGGPRDSNKLVALGFAHPNSKIIGPNAAESGDRSNRSMLIAAVLW